MIWPCDRCREQGHETPGVRNMGAEGLCSQHLTELYAKFSPDAWVDGGVGLQSGPARPEYGPLEYDITCCCCGAGWTGIPGDRCWWCQRAREIQHEHQHDLLLTPPAIDSDDETYEARMVAWAERLAVGVEAGIITADQARNAGRYIDRKTA